MTNEEYEALCLDAVGYLKELDSRIAEGEHGVALLQEERREIINRYNLNKTCKSLADHEFTIESMHTCVKCGAKFDDDYNLNKCAHNNTYEFRSIGYPAELRCSDCGELLSCE